MLRFALLFLLPLLALPVQASPWITVQRGAYRYLMPPIACRVGQHPDFIVMLVPQAQLDASLPKKLRRAGKHLFAVHDRIDAQAVIYISSALPHRGPPAYQDVFQHELAHLRGCEHGKVTPP